MKQNRFKKVMVSVALISMMVLLTACPHRKTEVVDLGTIPEEYLATVPYQNGDVVKMQHESDRLVIDFRVIRKRDYTPVESEGSKTSLPPSVIYNYETDITQLVPDYPTFEIQIEFSNQYMQSEQYEEGYDIIPKQASLFTGTSTTSFPFIGTDATGYVVLDSIEVNGHVYYDVFKLKCDHYSVYEDPIYASICYYNYEKGIIGIEMSNNEKYWLYEE